MSMEKSSLIRQLDYHQQKIGGVLRWVAPILAKGAVSSGAVDELLSRRMELPRLLVKYALFKHRDVFERWRYHVRPVCPGLCEEARAVDRDDSCRSLSNFCTMAEEKAH